MLRALADEYLLTLLSEIGRRQHARHGQVLRHLLQDLNEETDLHLCRLLEQRIQGSCSLRLAQDAEPLLDGAQLVLEVLVERGRSHLLERVLVLVNVGQPLLGGTLHLVRVARVRVASSEVHLGGRTHAAVGEWGREAAHVGGCTEVVAGADGARPGRTQRAGPFRGAVPVGGDVGHGDGSRFCAFVGCVGGIWILSGRLVLWAAGVSGDSGRQRGIRTMYG